MEIRNDLEWAKVMDRCQIPNEEEFTIQMEECLQHEFKTTLVKKIQETSTGFVNKSAIYEIDGKNYFVKYNGNQKSYERFQTEHDSLLAIRATDTITVPEPKKIIDFPRGASLVIEYWDGMQNMENYWQGLGNKLARLHMHNSSRIKDAIKNESSIHYSNSEYIPVRNFGFHRTTCYGTKLFIPPVWENTWTEYFSRHLLDYVFHEAEKKSSRHELRELWSELQLYMDKAFEETDILPSLIHGDICEVNVAQRNNEAVTFDPQCSYAHSLFELFQMNSLEAGIFPDEFFVAYHSLIPKRKDHNLHTTLYDLFCNLAAYVHDLGEGFRNNAIDNCIKIIAMLKEKI